MNGSSHKYYFNKLSEVQPNILSKVIAIDAALFPQPWTEKQWLESLSFQNYFLSLTFINNEMVAFSLYYLLKDDAFSHLYKIIVLPAQRGCGIAQTHLNHDIRELKASSITKVYLEVETTNEPAIRAYVKNGFQKIVTKKHFYGHEKHAGAMSLEL